MQVRNSCKERILNLIFSTAGRTLCQQASCHQNVKHDKPRCTHKYILCNYWEVLTTTLIALHSAEQLKNTDE